MSNDDVLASIREALEMMKARHRTILVSPADVERVQAAVSLLPYAGLITVHASDLVEPGQGLVVSKPVLNEVLLVSESDA